MLTSNQVHVDTALSQISVAYKNPDFIFQNEVFPVVPVDKRSDIFFKFSKQHFRQIPDTAAPGSDPNEIQWDLDARGLYYCDGHKLNLPTPDEIEDNADPGADLDIENTLKLTEAVRLNEEINGAALLSTTNISQNSTLSGTSQWSDFVNSDPFLVVDQKKTTIRNSTGLMPNQMVIPEQVFLTLRNHPKLIDRVKYTGTGLRNPLTADELAAAFGVSKVVIAAGLKQSVLEGRADSLTSIWGKNVLLYYKVPNPGKRTPALGYTFVWTVTPGQSGRLRGDLNSANGGFIIKRWREEGRDIDSMGIRYYYDQRIVEANAAYLFVNAIA